MNYLLDKFDYTRKAIVYAQKHDIPRLNVKLNSLVKQRDIIKNGNMMRAPKIPDPKKYVPYAVVELEKATIFVNPNPHLLSMVSIWLVEDMPDPYVLLQLHD